MSQPDVFPPAQYTNAMQQSRVSPIFPVQWSLISKGSASQLFGELVFFFHGSGNVGADVWSAMLDSSRVVS
jgi:hypothetical protein